jgi:hypothetical protein
MGKRDERFESQRRWKCVMRMFNRHNDVYFGPMRVERQEAEMAMTSKEAEMAMTTIFPFQI